MLPLPVHTHLKPTKNETTLNDVMMILKIMCWVNKSNGDGSQSRSSVGEIPSQNTGTVAKLWKSFFVNKQKTFSGLINFCVSLRLFIFRINLEIFRNIADQFVSLLISWGQRRNLLKPIPKIIIYKMERKYIFTCERNSYA